MMRARSMKSLGRFLAEAGGNEAYCFAEKL